MSTRSTAYSAPGSSAASCLGLMEKTEAAAWPSHGLIHVATPSTSDIKATTLAKD